ncbi:MAG TPA: sigma factor-like helix-turn-helix DNA-binding protein [Nakamurella sp.]|jgi:DNA-directed RNA polymerase specialized sigma24 family protein
MAIGRLPAGQARLINALLDGGKTYAQISAELGIARGTIGPTRARAMRTLRAILGGQADPGASAAAAVASWPGRRRSAGAVRP